VGFVIVMLEYREIGYYAVFTCIKAVVKRVTMSIEYYNQNAKTFYDGTLAVDMSSLYSHFEPFLCEGGLILDAGCGSGRDSLYFQQRGFQVVAMDASSELAQMATQLIGLPVEICRFDEFHHGEAFDGIWACASLLHVPMAELAPVVQHLANLLKSGGLFYCSFKYGEGESVRDDRTFTNLDEKGLARLVQDLPLEIRELWQTEDLRPGRGQECWLNAILVKQ